MADAPPRYSSGEEAHDYYADEKHVPAQQQLDASYSPVAKTSLANLSSAMALSRADSQGQNMGREALLANPASFAVSAPPRVMVQRSPTDQTSTQAFYTPQQAAVAFASQASLSRQASDATANTTNQTLLSRQAYDPNQREANHMSYLSSLSSGFGDGLLISEPGARNTMRNSHMSRQNPRETRNFSWERNSTLPLKGDRDTVYTASSVDSNPRFRSVTSWVAQQTGRLEKQQQAAGVIPQMPEIPLPLQIARAHQRKTSEDPAFSHHPGDEIQISRGSRVPSVILDKKTGMR